MIEQTIQALELCPLVGVAAPPPTPSQGAAL